MNAFSQLTSYKEKAFQKKNGISIFEKFFSWGMRFSGKMKGEGCEGKPANPPLHP